MVALIRMNMTGRTRIVSRGGAKKSIFTPKNNPIKLKPDPKESKVSKCKPKSSNRQCACHLHIFKKKKQ